MQKYENCLYWREEKCTGFNCCMVKDCYHTEKFQPWQKDKQSNVDHPKHYTAGKYEVIDIITSIVNSMELKPVEGYFLGNIIKYISRYKHKNGTEDLQKARWYLDRLIKESEFKGQEDFD
jgi:hypothetical protein